MTDDEIAEQIFAGEEAIKVANRLIDEWPDMPEESRLGAKAKIAEIVDINLALSRLMEAFRDGEEDPNEIGE